MQVQPGRLLDGRICRAHVSCLSQSDQLLSREKAGDGGDKDVMSCETLCHEQAKNRGLTALIWWTAGSHVVARGIARMAVLLEMLWPGRNREGGATFHVTREPILRARRVARGGLRRRVARSRHLHPQGESTREIRPLEQKSGGVYRTEATCKWGGRWRCASEGEVEYSTLLSTHQNITIIETIW